MSILDYGFFKVKCWRSIFGLPNDDDECSECGHLRKDHESCGCSGFESAQKTPLSAEMDLPEWVIEQYIPEYKGYVYRFTDRCDNCQDQESKRIKFEVEHKSGIEIINYCEKCVKEIEDRS